MTSTGYTELQLSELFDQPSSPVRAKVFICATGRTGSSLLCRAMFHHGIGLPHEYFNAGHIALIGQRSGIHPLADGRRLGSDSEARRAYIAALMDRRTANGIFAAKIHWGQYASYLDNPEGVELFQQAHFIQLYREDLLAQAISFHVSKETGRWGSADTVSTPPASIPRFFDVDLIADYIKMLAESDTSWRLFFARNAILPLTFSYERVRDDLAGVLRTIVDNFGLDLPTDCFDYAEEGPNEERDAEVPPRSEIKARFLRAHQRVIPALRPDAQRPAGDMNVSKVELPPTAPPAGTAYRRVLPTDEPRPIELNAERIEVGYPAGSQSEKSPTQPCTEAQTAAVEVGRPAPDQGQTAAPGRTDAEFKTIGLCMIVKNEAKLLRQCLTSTLPLIDYVLVVDTGSEDGTQQIIREFLAEHAVRGAVIDEPWRDFAYNRTFALERLREVEDIDYALIIDADDVVVLDASFDPRAFKTQMEHDLYDVQILHDGMSHFRAQICRNRLPFSFKGVVHEYLEVPTGTSSRATAEGFSIHASTGGARGQNPRKYQDDAALLERALASETDPFLISRYTFYLAQSQKDCGEREKALDNYLKRAELGYWNEEIYISLLEAGNLMAALDRPFDEVIATYERAAQTVPARAEALHAASLYCRQQGRNAEGQEYARRGIELTPPVGGLFVQGWVYDYGILDEFAINAYWAGAYRESLDASLKLLAGDKLPPSLVKHVADNARFAADKLPEPKAPDLGVLGAENMVDQHKLVPARTLRSRVTGPPRVLVAILAQQKEPALSLYLECIEALDYPKSSIVLYIRTDNNTDRTQPILREWVARVGHLYAAVDFDGSDVPYPVEQYSEHEWNATRFKVLGHIRNASPRRALDLGCDFYFVADVDNFIRPATLRELVALDLPIAAPLLRSIVPERFYSNYHAEIDAAGYYKNCDQYYWILNRHVRGIVEVPVVNCTYLVRADMIPELTYEEESGRHEYVIFSDSARKAGIPQYLDNRQVYGYIAFGEGEQHLGAGIERARALLHGAGDRTGCENDREIAGPPSGDGPLIHALPTPEPRTYSKAAWEANLAEELRFWRVWLTEPRFANDRDYRLSSRHPFKQHLLQFLPQGQDTYAVLDVGSGPVSDFGLGGLDKIINLYMVDPLASEYNALLNELRLCDAVRPINVAGEDLTKAFPNSFFDLVHCSNALDHSCDPMRVIREMIAVCKPGCWTHLSHVNNVAVIESYHGLHQWNLDIEDGRFVVWNREERHDVVAEIDGISEVVLEQLPADEYRPPLFRATLRK
jgi:LPS sulfotransferase NodH/tetratricopeptide (TPR) repeat protein/SAM-dependent methyltransferase